METVARPEFSAVVWFVSPDDFVVPEVVSAGAFVPSDDPEDSEAPEDVSDVVVSDSDSLVVVSSELSAVVVAEVVVVVGVKTIFCAHPIVPAAIARIRAMLTVALSFFIFSSRVITQILFIP